MAGSGGMVNVARYTGVYADPADVRKGNKPGVLGGLVVVHFVDGKPVTQTSCAQGAEHFAKACQRKLVKKGQLKFVDLRFDADGNKCVATSEQVEIAVHGRPLPKPLSREQVRANLEKLRANGGVLDAG